MNSTGKRIKKAREAKGMTQDEFALKMGKSSKATVSSWENDKNEPTVTDFKKIAELLNTTVAYLIGETENPPQAQPDMMYISKDEYIALQKKALQREEEKNRELTAQIKELKND